MRRAQFARLSGLNARELYMLECDSCEASLEDMACVAICPSMCDVGSFLLFRHFSALRGRNQDETKKKVLANAANLRCRVGKSTAFAIGVAR